MLKRFMFKASSKVICIVLALSLLAVSCFYTVPAHAGVVSDVFGLDGFGGKVADDVFDGGCKLAGGTTYNLAKNVYDSAVGSIKLLTEDHTTTGKVAGWMDVGLNLAATGAIITTLIMGTATFPVIATITVTITAAKMAVDNIKNLDKIFSWLKKNLGDVGKSLLDVYKPNIYIYCDQDIEVNVQLKPYRYITASIPEYDPTEGWTAKVYQGSINGGDDYLFYEAKVPDNHFQRREGFRIKGKSLRTDLWCLMEMYDFNVKETADFVEYWFDKLPQTDNYVFYPQDTETIEKIMPLTVTPAPDTIERLWFLIENDRGQYIQTVFPIDKVTRNGLAVVEWGGVMGGGE
ncbi:MAG: hypothetical protein CVU90_12155 [Firmicutes bacterium HGW-Firmicutes-15]|nr:MAG: hypothetical protein CVU90_12155 [Firmicutes bacterium HGW-Firmicutes-15]